MRKKGPEAKVSRQHFMHCATCDSGYKLFISGLVRLIFHERMLLPAGKKNVSGRQDILSETMEKLNLSLYFNHNAVHSRVNARYGRETWFFGLFKFVKSDSKRRGKDAVAEAAEWAAKEWCSHEDRVTVDLGTHSFSKEYQEGFLWSYPLFPFSILTFYAYSFYRITISFLNCCSAYQSVPMITSIFYHQYQASD